jgi:AcrR family transcriptional regulator
MLRASLLLLIAVVGCAGAEMGPLPQGTPAPEPATSFDSLVGPAGETNVEDRSVGQHPRRIIYTANIDIVVEEFEAIPRRIAELAEQFGGYVASSNLQGQPGSPRRGSWTIRVPVERYSDLLSKARELGELRSLTSNSQDVSEEYYDIEARIRNKEKTEARLVALLEEATGNLEQVLEVEQKLDGVREEIERMQGRLRVLADQTSLATVTVTVEQIPGYQPEAKPTYGTRVERAFRSSLHALVTTAADLSIVLVALSPWLAVLLVLSLIVGPIVLTARRIRRRQKREPPPESPVSAQVVDGD